MAMASASASGVGPQSHSSTTCDSSFGVGGELPYRINSTFICGVNPYTNRTVLEKCCQGPITNITSPAPTSGPLSDSWPVTCLAYCAIMLKPTYSPMDDVVYNNFITCLTDGNASRNVVCTEANGFAPNQCIPFSESVGCTDGLTHSTWRGSSYISSPMSTTAAPSETTSGVAPRSTTASTTTTSRSSDETGTSPSPTKSAAQHMKPLDLSSIIAVALVFQVLIFSLL